MRPERLSPVHLLLTLSLSTVMFSARVTWTQEMPPASKSPAQAPVLAPHSVAVPDAGIRFNPAYEELSLPFAHQESSLLRFRPLDVGSLIPLTKNYTSNVPRQLTKMDEPQAKANHLMGNAPAEWLISSIPQDKAHYRTLEGDDVLQYYGHRVPWAGRIMLRVGRQAAFHPRVVRAFELIRPALSLGKPTYPRWLGR